MTKQYKQYTVEYVLSSLALLFVCLLVPITGFIFGSKSLSQIDLTGAFIISLFFIPATVFYLIGKYFKGLKVYSGYLEVKVLGEWKEVRFVNISKVEIMHRLLSTYSVVYDNNWKLINNLDLYQFFSNPYHRFDYSRLLTFVNEMRKFNPDIKTNFE